MNVQHLCIGNGAGSGENIGSLPEGTNVLDNCEVSLKGGVSRVRVFHLSDEAAFLPVTVLDAVFFQGREGFGLRNIFPQTDVLLLEGEEGQLSFE